MAEIQKKPVKIVETVLRDAHQSLIATRMSTEQMLPIIDKMDKIGYYAVECWGGATFDASLRFLKEDPWERLRKLRAGFKNTKLQMLFRGQNILGYNHYADDVVEYFVQKSVANGIDIIRIFDCLNDLRNLKTAVKAANKEKAHAQIALCYTLGDAYTLDYWKEIAKENRRYGRRFHLYQGYGWSVNPVCSTGAGKRIKKSLPSCRSTCIHPLHLRCSFHDLLKGCRGRLRHHRYRNLPAGTWYQSAGNRGYGRDLQGHSVRYRFIPGQACGDHRLLRTDP